MFFALNQNEATDFEVVASTNGVSLPKTLRTLTLRQAHSLLLARAKQKGVGPIKFSLLAKVLELSHSTQRALDKRQNAPCVSQYFDRLAKYIDQQTVSIEQLHSDAARRKSLRGFFELAADLPYSLDPAKKLLVRGYFTSAGATLNKVGQRHPNNADKTGVTRERARQIMHEAFLPIVTAQGENAAFAGKLRKFSHALILAGAGKSELKKLRSYLKYAVGETARRQAKLCGKSLVNLAKEHIREQERTGVFPVTVEMFERALERRLGLTPVRGINFEEMRKSKVALEICRGRHIMFKETIKDRIRFLLLKHPKGLRARKIASVLDEDIRIIHNELRRFAELFYQAPDTGRFKLRERSRQAPHNN